MSRQTGRATTFGFELEFNIAFTKDVLLQTLAKHNINYTAIQKHHSDAEHTQLLGNSDVYSRTCRQEYPSWAIVMPLDASDPYTNPLLTTSTYNSYCKETDQPVRVRGYVSEPLLILQDLLRQQKLPSDVRASIRKVGHDQAEVPLPNDSASPGRDYLLCNSADYARWTLTNDHTLIGSLKSQLLQQLPSKITVSNVANCDSHGVELISPIFQLSSRPAAKDSLQQYLSSISRNPDVGIITSTWAGLHVHIGFNATNPADICLRTIQHLAYILLIHEDLITSLFPRHCSGLEQSPLRPEVEEPEDPYAGLAEEEFEAVWAKEQAELDAVEAISSPAEQGSVNSDNTDSPSLTPTLSPTPTSSPSLDGSTNHSSPFTTNETLVLEAESSFTNHQNKLSNARHLASILNKPHPLAPSDIYTSIFHESHTVQSVITLLQRPKSPSHPDADRYRGYMYNFSNLHSFMVSGHGKPTVEFRQHECCIDALAVNRWVTFVESIVRKAEECSVEYATTALPKEDVATFCEWIGLSREDVGYWIDRQERFSR